MRKFLAVLVAVWVLVFAGTAQANMWTQASSATEPGVASYGMKSDLTYSLLQGTAGGNCPKSGCYVLGGSYFQSWANGFIEPMILNAGGPSDFYTCWQGNATGGDEYCNDCTNDARWDTSTGAYLGPANCTGALPGVSAQPGVTYVDEIQFDPTSACCGWNVTIGPYTEHLNNVFAPQRTGMANYLETSNDVAQASACVGQSHIHWLRGDGVWVTANDGGTVQASPLHSAWANPYTRAYEWVNDPGCTPP